MSCIFDQLAEFLQALDIDPPVVVLFNQGFIAIDLTKVASLAVLLIRLFQGLVDLFEHLV